MRRHGLTLLIDADDTLWENNIYFEEVIDAFCGLIEARGGSREAAREALYAIERVRTRTNGYGVKNFHGSLRQTCCELLGDDHATEVAEIEKLCASLARRRVAILPEVEETLRELSGRHRMILFTKGDLDDQLQKVQRSGLGRYFHRVDVVREKDTGSYVDAAMRHGFRADAAWMVGNSPKSDILPALDAGLGAVFIPHERTWELERGELPPVEGLDGRLLVLDRFGDLTDHF